MVRIRPPEPERPALRPTPARAVTRGVAAIALVALAGMHMAGGQWLLAASAVLFAMMATVSAWTAARGTEVPWTPFMLFFGLGVAAWAGSCFLPPP